MVIDAIKLRRSKELIDFLTMLFTSPNSRIICHSAKHEVHGLSKTFEFPFDIFQDNEPFLDIVPLFTQISDSKKTGLKAMVKELLSKDLSKLEQISDWNSRPLRESQIHYAALDAFIVLKLHEEIVMKMELQKVDFARNAQA